MSRDDEPPEKIIKAVEAATEFVTQQDMDKASVYLGLIEGVPEGDCLRNLLWALGRQIPVAIITSAARPCPRWLMAQADRAVIIGPGVPLDAAAQAMAAWADWFLRHEPWLAKRRRN